MRVLPAIFWAELHSSDSHESTTRLGPWVLDSLGCNRPLCLRVVQCSPEGFVLFRNFSFFHFHRLFHFLISFLESTSPLKATPMHFFYHPSLTCQSPSRVPMLVFDIRTVTFLSIMKMNARVYLGICQKSYRWIKCYVCEKSNRAISVREQSLAQIILNSEGLRGFL